MSNITKSIASSLIGNTLEWFEYTLYAYFAVVISKLFFPLDNDFVAMAMTFATFAIGLAARPLGGIIFGYIADRFSRKQTMTITMLLMSIPTMCIGLLPTYEKIGIIAPLLLISLRILQGVALGGEFGSSCVYLFESAPSNNRGLFGTLALTGVGTGLVLSSCTIFIIETFISEEAIYSYAWRIPFFISVFGSILGLYMRQNLLETNDFLKAKEANQLVKIPLFDLFKDHKMTLVKLFSIFLTTQIAFFVVFIYSKTMMIETLGFDRQMAGLYSLMTVVSYTISTVIFGYLADKLDKRYIILTGVVGLFLASMPFIESLKSGESLSILFMCISLGVLIGMSEGTLNPLVAESFPTNIRTTGVAFCWNFTAVAFGGAAPIVAMWLIDKTQGVEAVAYYLMTACAISIVGLVSMLLRSKKKQNLHRKIMAEQPF